MSRQENKSPRSPLWPYVAQYCENPTGENLEQFLHAIKKGGPETFFSRLIRITTISALERAKNVFGDRWAHLDKESSARIHSQILSFAGEFAKEGNEVFESLMEQLLSEVSPPEKK
jgi:hypothetical protein